MCLEKRKFIIAIYKKIPDKKVLTIYEQGSKIKLVHAKKQLKNNI